MIYSIFEQSLIALPLIFGAYITLSLLKLPDFSLESAYLFGAVFAYLAKDLPMPLVILSSIAGGMTVGMVVFFLNQTLKIPYLLAAIVTNGLIHGLTLFLLKGSVNGFSIANSINEFTLLLIVLVIIVTIFFILLASEMGYCFAIYGNNPQFFDNHQISKKIVVLSGVLCGHGLAGLSGFLFSLTSGVVDLTMNFGIIMLCLTSLMIGKLLKKGDHPNLIVPILGIIGYFLMQQILLKMGLNLKYFNAFQALFVLTILFIGKRKITYTLDHLGV